MDHPSTEGGRYPEGCGCLPPPFLSPMKEHVYLFYRGETCYRETGTYCNKTHKFNITSSRIATRQDMYPGKKISNPDQLMTPDTPQTLSGSSNSHSRLAPSSAKSWTRCTASIKFVEENKDRILPIKVSEVIRLTPYLLSIPAEEVFDHEWRAIEIAENVRLGKIQLSDLSEDQIKDIWKSAGSEAARLGTRAHEFAAAILLGQKTLEDIPEEFRPHVKTYVDYCNSLVPENEEPYIEEKVKLFYSENPEDTGTCDFCVVTSDRIDVADLKYGAGVMVHAEGNEQLAIYTLSFVKSLEGLYDFKPSTMIVMHIVQPRHHEAKEIKTWTLSLHELQDFCRDIEKAAIQIRVNNPLVIAFAPSEDACQWCDAKKFCTARLNRAVEGFENEELPAIDLLTEAVELSKPDSKLPVEARLAKRFENQPVCLDDDLLLGLWKASKAIESILGDVDEYINDRALCGDTFDGEVKLVAGREGNRKWKSTEDADAFLKNQRLKEEERYDFTLKGPAKIEVILKEKLAKTTRTRNLFESLIERSAAKYVAALSSDKRPAIVQDSAEGFSDEEELDADNA